MMPVDRRGDVGSLSAWFGGAETKTLSPNLRDLSEEGAVLLSQKMSNEGFLTLSLEYYSIVCAQSPVEKFV